MGPQCDGISVLKGKDTRELAFPLFAYITEERPCEHKTKRQPSTSRKESSHQKLVLGLSTSQNCKKINFCCLNHPVCSILLWHPKITNICHSYISGLCSFRAPVYHGRVFQGPFKILDRTTNCNKIPEGKEGRHHSGREN